MPNFAIGTRDEVEVSVDASCCAAGISIRAVDVHDNEVSKIQSPLNVNPFLPSKKGVLYKNKNG
jgi:hypothetical protein